MGISGGRGLKGLARMAWSTFFHLPNVQFLVLGFRTLARMVFALFCSFGNVKKKMTKIVSEKVLQAPWCTFDRRGAGLKLFGQCPWKQHISKGGFSNEDDEDDDNKKDDKEGSLPCSQSTPQALSPCLGLKVKVPAII